MNVCMYRVLGVMGTAGHSMVAGVSGLARGKSGVLMPYRLPIDIQVLHLGVPRVRAPDHYQQPCGRHVLCSMLLQAAS